MRFFAITFLLILAFAMAFDASVLDVNNLNLVKIGDLHVPRPFDRDAISSSNSIESYQIDDATCQTSACAAVDGFECIASATVDANSAIPDSLKSTALGCVMDCAGAYYGCETVDDSTCSIFKMTQSKCAASFRLGDDWTDDGTDDTTADDDIGISALCGSSCYYGAYQGAFQAVADCGPDVIGLNASDVLRSNSICTENKWGDSCFELFNASTAIAYGAYGGCDAFYNAINWMNIDPCEEVADWGCCTGTMSYAYPACVSEYLSSNCSVDLSNKCSKGMFVDVKSVSSSLTLDSYADLDDTTIGYTYMYAIAAGASTGGEMIDMSYVDIPMWMGSMTRRLRGSNADEEQRRLMGSTDVDFEILFLDGAYISSSGVSTAVDSAAFNAAVNMVVNNTISSKTAAVTKTYMATSLFADDDAAFSAPLNVVLVLASMFLGLMLF